MEQAQGLVTPGRRGVTNRQMIPVLKQVVAEDTVDKLVMLKSQYPDAFNSSVKYLKKLERDYMVNHMS